MDKGKQFKADMMLVLVTLCWGASYYLMDVCLTEMDPFTLNSFRFLVAFFVAAALSWKKIKKVNRETLKAAALVGFVLIFVYIGATFGVKYTTLSNSGFLCAMTTVFTPLISLVCFREKLGKKMWLVVGICFIGMALLTLKDDFTINMANLKGDLLCLMCGLAYAVDLIITDRQVKNEKVDAYSMGVFQLGVTGTCNIILAFITETPHCPETPFVWGATLFLAIFSTGVAFVVQPIAQQHTTASHTGVIFALEPVFAAIVAMVIVHEFLSPKSAVGAFLMVASIFIMEIDFSSLVKKK